jgi:Cu/Ag efflux pump CusA
VATALRPLTSPPLPGPGQPLIKIDRPVASIDQLSRQVVLRRPQGEIKLADLARLSVVAAPRGCVCMHKGRAAICGTVWGRPGADHPAARLRALAQQLTPRKIHIATGKPVVLRVALPPDRAQDTVAAAGRLWQALAPALGGQEALLLLGDVAEPDRDGEIWLATGGDWQELLHSAARVPNLSVLPTAAVARPSTVHVYGEDLEGLAATAQRLRDNLGALSGVLAIELVGLERRPEIELKLDRDRLARFGLRTADVQLHLRAALLGLELGTIGKTHLPLRLVLRASDRPGRTSMEDLLRVTVRAPAGAVPLAQLGAVQLTSRPHVLLRRNRRRCVSVRAWGPQLGIGWDARFARAAQSVSVPADQKIELELEQP